MYTFIIHHRLRSNDVNDEHTKKKDQEERRRRKNKSEEKKVCDGSDIFTQLPHTNRTTEVHTRIKNKHSAVKRAS
jgi:hypothetical protein